MSNKKIIGIGLNRTGTTTLGLCLQHLGYHHTSVHEDAFACYRDGNMDKLLEIVSGYDSFEDWPWPLVYREIDRAFPDSKFILTGRISADIWLNSISRLARLTGPTEYRRLVYGHAMPDGHESEYLDYYHRHNREVEEYFRDRPDKLLVVSWDSGNGWDELCEFIGCAVPDLPFPHVNRSDRLEEMLRQQQREQ